MNEENTFTTSLHAQKTARAIVLLAKERGYLDGPLATAPELGNIEKNLLFLRQSITLQRFLNVL